MSALEEAFRDLDRSGYATASARAEVERMKKALEEREADMHDRIRKGYDKTVADCWRAKVAEVEGNALRRVHELRSALIAVVNAVTTADCSHEVRRRVQSIADAALPDPRTPHPSTEERKAKT